MILLLALCTYIFLAKFVEFSHLFAIFSIFFPVAYFPIFFLFSLCSPPKLYIFRLVAEGGGLKPPLTSMHICVLTSTNILLTKTTKPQGHASSCKCQKIYIAKKIQLLDLSRKSVRPLLEIDFQQRYFQHFISRARERCHAQLLRPLVEIRHSCRMQESLKFT